MITLLDEERSHMLPVAPFERRTILDGWFVEENYFFEWCYWVGLAVVGVAYAPWGLIALGGQLIIIASIFGVTGIPPTEAQAVRSKGEAYRAYQARVSRFFPLPPKRTRPLA